MNKRNHNIQLFSIASGLVIYDSQTRNLNRTIPTKRNVPIRRAIISADRRDDPARESVNNATTIYEYFMLLDMDRRSIRSLYRTQFQA
jgi:hypothetical protein